jgi:maltose alpha-D-glucosyltransferase/alpha-amylase
MSFSSWYKNAVFYEVYVRAFYDSNADGHGDLNGLSKKLDYLIDLGVDCLWLLPISASPLKDDGYDISDYYDLHPDFGTLDDFEHLLKEAHQRGLHVIIDLVMNHTSDEHPWFQAAHSDRNSPYRDYYVWSDSDQKYAGTRIIFRDTEKSNWTWDPVAGQYYWHRFYACQPDLNYDNPRVQEEMLNVLKFWLEKGVDGFRVDAIPYLFEREGTNCENLPETHTYIKRLRRFVDENYPGRILLCEANQWPRDVSAYFGDGDEFNMAFNFPLMPRIFMSLQRADLTPIKWALEQTSVIPDSCQWCTFLRNHDELTLEMVTEEERQWMWQVYAPEPRMRLNLGIRRRLAPLLDNDRNRIELAYSLLFTLPGSPIIYYGDEIGMGDNLQLPDRNGVRTPMQWDEGVNAGFSTGGRLYTPVLSDDIYCPQRVNVAAQRADPGSLWQTIKKMIALRKQHPALCCGNLAWLDCGTTTVAAYWRTQGRERMLIINNLSADSQSIACPLPPDIHGNLKDILTGQMMIITGNRLTVSLQPYETRWLLISG